MINFRDLAKPTIRYSDEDRDAQFARKPSEKKKVQDKRKSNGRKKGSVNKKTLEKIKQAEREILGSRHANAKLAIDHMDDMIEYFRGLVAIHQPWAQDGSKREGKDEVLWFRCVDAFRDFLALRAPYQSARLSAMAIMPQAARQRTVVNVTILNERGEKVYSDTPEMPGDDARVIEHDDEEAA